MIVNLEASRRKAGEIIGFVKNPLHGVVAGAHKTVLALLEKPKGCDESPYLAPLLRAHPTLLERGAQVNVLFVKLLHGGNRAEGLDLTQVRAVFFRPVLPEDLLIAYDGFCEVPVRGMTKPAHRSVARIVADPTRQDFDISPGYSGAFVAKGGQHRHKDCGYVKGGSLKEGAVCPLSGLDSLEGFGFFQSRLRGDVPC